MHLRDYTLEELGAAAQYGELLNNALHQMMRRDAPVTGEEAGKALFGWEPRVYRSYAKIWEEDTGLFEIEERQVKRYQRPVFDYDRPDVPLNRLLELIEGARAWTGRPLRWRVDDLEPGQVVVVTDPVELPRGAWGIGPRTREVEAFVQRHIMAEFSRAFVVGILAACVAYGEKDNG